MTRTRTSTVLALAAAIPLAIAGCVSPSSGSDDGGTAGPATTSVTVATPALATTFDWDAGGLFSNENFEVITNTQANLIRNPYVEDSEGHTTQDYSSFEGVLADADEPYTVSEDGLTYTFNLREGVVSQSGQPFTADDVVYSFERKYGSATSPAPSNFNLFMDGLEAIEEIDDQHVAFTLRRASDGFSFLGVMANINARIYDQETLTAHATAEDPYALEWAKQNSGWGFGAYTVASSTPDQEMVLEANPDYVLGEPEIEKITYRQVTDPGTRVTMLQSGDVDFAEQLRPTDQASLAEAEGVVVPSVANPIEFLNLAAVTRQAPFDDATVRRALTYAVPYDEIVEQVYEGRAVESQGLIIPSTKGYTTEGLPEYTYDPARARQLLAQAGHTTPVAFTLHVSSSVPDAVDAAQLIRSYAVDAGFDVTVQTETASSFATGRSTAAFQAMVLRTRAQTQSPVYMTASWFLPGDNPNNVTRWEDPEFYALVEQARAVDDPLSEEAGLLWNRAMAREMDQAPETPIAFPQPSMAYADTFTGYGYRTDNTFDFSILGPA
ncbi:ABC transporter substrate-binding protein [Kineococcus sp. SYSU DK003]|uniref:ABC transporter substrate-binding protein n=1 Tax=Kineococcus sp. SYSU DK003 TaxID=3383124 RepID=UPI003D7EF7BD